MAFHPAAVLADDAGDGARLDPVGLPLGNGADALAAATARTVGAILVYARWPGARQPDPVRVCIAGTPAHGAHLGSMVLANGRSIRVAAWAFDAPDPASRCDALYIGAMALPALRALIARTRGRAVLTVAEGDPACRSQAMVCLVPEPGQLSFAINIDAVSRSTVTVDARVLRMSKGYRR